MWICSGCHDENPAVDLLRTLGNVFYGLCVLVAVLVFFAAGSMPAGHFRIGTGVLAAVLSSIAYIVPAVTLKALSAILGNSEKTNALLRYKIDIDQDERETRKDN